MGSLETQAAAALCGMLILLVGIWIGYTTRSGDEVLQGYGKRMAERTLEKQEIGE